MPLHRERRDATVQRAVELMAPLARVLMRRRDSGDQRLDAAPVRDVDVRTLAHLSSVDTMPMRELADRLAVTPGRVTQIVDKLESQGRVRRTRDADDRRVWQVGLTAHARHAIDSYYSTRSQAVEETLAALTPEEQRAVVRFLEGVVTRLSAIDHEDDGLEPQMGAELALREAASSVA